MSDAQLRMTGAILIAVALLIAGIDRASRATAPIVQSVRLPDAYTQQWAEHQAPRQKEQLNLKRHLLHSFAHCRICAKKRPCRSCNIVPKTAAFPTQRNCCRFTGSMKKHLHGCKMIFISHNKITL